MSTEPEATPDSAESLEHEPIHDFFGLTYASYLVLPRSILQSMPVGWQRRFVACLEEADEAMGDLEQPAYRVNAVDEAGRFIEGDFRDYERGRRRVPLRPFNAPPFDFLKCERACQMLIAAGFRDDLLTTIYAIYNAVAAAGKDSETFTRVIAIIVKIKASNVLTDVRVNQLAAAGINVRNILQKKLNLSDDDLTDIGNLQLKADVVIPALVEGLNEQFAGELDEAANHYLGALEALEFTATTDA